jgi:single-stranded-DNA-specific exonuclease
MPLPEYVVDAELEHGELSLDSVDLLSRLEPFGAGNPQPVVLIRNVRYRHVKSSRDGKHLLFEAVDERGRSHGAVLFGGGRRIAELLAHPAIDVIARLNRDTWRGRTRLKLYLVDFRPA